MDRGACQATVHGVAKSWTQLSDISFRFHSHTDISKNTFIGLDFGLSRPPGRQSHLSLKFSLFN